MAEKPSERPSSFLHAQRRVTCTFNADDGTSEADGSTGCLGASTTLTSTQIDVSHYDKMDIYIVCPDVVTAMTADYQTSPDGTNWVAGEAAITNLDNNSQVITPTENAVRYIRLRVLTNTNAATTALLFCVVCKS